MMAVVTSLAGTRHPRRDSPTPSSITLCKVILPISGVHALSISLLMQEFQFPFHHLLCHPSLTTVSISLICGIFVSFLLSWSNSCALPFPLASLQPPSLLAPGLPPASSPVEYRWAMVRGGGEAFSRLFPSCKYWNYTSFGLLSNLPENSTQKLPGLTVKGKVQILYSLWKLIQYIFHIWSIW